MALPLSRNHTYSPSDPVRANDLNDIQDRIIALHGREIEVKTLNLSPLAGTGNTAADFSAASSGVTADSNGSWHIPLPLLAGDTLLTVRFYHNLVTGHSNSFSIKAVYLTGAATPEPPVNAAVGEDTEVVIGTGVLASTLLSPNFALLDDEQLHLEWSAPSAGDLLIGVAVTFARPMP